MAIDQGARKVLLVGFDSAWTPGNRGALVAVVMSGDGAVWELGVPRPADFLEATTTIRKWQQELAPSRTLILLDQPTVVRNPIGQRPVEHLVSSPVSRRYGGVQPANTSKSDMFGVDAPLWPFLDAFGGVADPLQPLEGTHVLETFPVLTMIALGWTLPDVRATGRLPKYNPERKSKFRVEDWSHVCRAAADAMRAQNIPELAEWLDDKACEKKPKKALQDGIDSCICLLVAAHLARGGEGIFVGDSQTGYIVSPYGDELYSELTSRCSLTGRNPETWIRSFRLNLS